MFWRTDRFAQEDSFTAAVEPAHPKLANEHAFGQVDKLARMVGFVRAGNSSLVLEVRSNIQKPAITNKLPVRYSEFRVFGTRANPNFSTLEERFVVDFGCVVA